MAGEDAYPSTGLSPPTGDKQSVFLSRISVAVSPLLSLKLILKTKTVDSDESHLIFLIYSSGSRTFYSSDPEE